MLPAAVVVLAVVVFQPPSSATPPLLPPPTAFILQLRVHLAFSPRACNTFLALIYTRQQKCGVENTGQGKGGSERGEWNGATRKVIRMKWIVNDTRKLAYTEKKTFPFNSMELKIE